MVKLNTTNGPSILDRLWSLLDEATTVILNEPWEQNEKEQGRARGIAEAIQVVSDPVFHSADAVVQAAVSRHGTASAFSGAPSIIHHAPPDGVLNSEQLVAQANEIVDVPAASPGRPLTQQQWTALAATLRTGVDAASAAALVDVTVEQAKTVLAQLVAAKEAE